MPAGNARSAGASPGRRYEMADLGCAQGGDKPRAGPMGLPSCFSSRNEIFRVVAGRSQTGDHEFLESLHPAAFQLVPEAVDEVLAGPSSLNSWTSFRPASFRFARIDARASLPQRILLMGSVPLVGFCSAQVPRKSPRYPSRRLAAHPLLRYRGGFKVRRPENCAKIDN